MENRRRSVPRSSTDTTGSWNTWAKFLVNETQRFSLEIEKLQEEIKNNNKQVNELETNVIRLTSSGSNEIINKDLTILQNEINQLEKKLEQVILDVSKLESFKDKAFAVFATVNTLLAISIGVIGLL